MALQWNSGEFDDAVDLSWSPSKQGAALRVLVKFDTAPTTSENIEVIYDSDDGPNFDTRVEVTDPSDGSVTDIVMLVNNPVALLNDDAVRVTYANSDGNRVNVTIIGTDTWIPGGN